MTTPVDDPVQVPMNEAASSIVAWRFKDGRRGHENQSLGLLAALSEIHSVTVCDVEVIGRHPMVESWRLLARRFPPGEHLPTPNLHIGAGHRTHLPMLAAKRARGGRTIVLMNPTLPRAWFDLCIVPEHDRGREQANVLRTRGVLNGLRVNGCASPLQGLFLIGGPSTHYEWSQDALIEQIVEITKHANNMQWTLATSPRTPLATTVALRNLTTAGIELAPFEAVDTAWLPQQLNQSSQVWVTEDSVSMVYEALTVGAAVGLISTPKLKPNRVSSGVDTLIAQGLVTPFCRWERSRSLPKPNTRLDEATRCADWIARHWL